MMMGRMLVAGREPWPEQTVSVREEVRMELRRRSEGGGRRRLMAQEIIAGGGVAVHLGGAGLRGCL